MRKCEVFYKNYFAGVLMETENGYEFTYDDTYLNNPESEPISLTLPLREKPYTERTMLPFFDGLIPEGWMLDLAVNNWKLNRNDRMGLLISCCGDTIGAVSIKPAE
ncbi:phosphatidylinositol kinase [bacterium]|nr:MAG: phosphatidylinositol kinase [bacterium]